MDFAIALNKGGSGPLSSWTFTSRHQVRGETWRPTEPVPVPLLSPKNSVLWPSTPPDPLDFTEHMQNFFMDHCRDAFGCMSEILGENFNFTRRKTWRSQMDSVNMWKVKNFLDLLKFKICQQSYTSRSLDGYSALMSDVVHDVPPELLGTLLHEELTEQRDRLLFSEGATGGALAYVPFSQNGSSSQGGCLLYPGNRGLDLLNFHRVERQPRGSSPCLDAHSSDPFSFQLKGPVRQISSASLFNDCCVAVRLDHLCGVWRFSESSEPRLLQAVNTREVATCISVSPHVLGEVLVASESGAAKLWTVGRGMQKVREEDSNLYFNAKSSWRWCEFSAHPRVMLYADRTGVELTDIRVNPVLSHTLFRISSTPECRNGERLILSRYLGDVHSFHHLVTTQYSAYIMDERFPSVPMLKWGHMMQFPPVFCHIVPGSTSSGSVAGTTKVLLGSHSSQEITLLQYSGGRAEACFSRGPPQSLLRPRDSLKHLPVQIPHRLDTATNRLSSPATGLTCIHTKGGREAGGEESLCILQLTEAGDIFYQILEPEQADASPPPAAEDEQLPQHTAKKLPQPTLREATTSGRKTTERLQPHSQLVISDTSSDEGIIEPTQQPTEQRHVAETPERDQQAQNMYSDSSSEDSDTVRESQKLKQLLLRVIVNDPELDQVSGLDAGVKDGEVVKNNADSTEDCGGVRETISGSSSLSRVAPCRWQTPAKLSDSTVVTWKLWLQKLMQRSREKKPRPHHLQHFTIKTDGLLHVTDDVARNMTEEEHVQSLRRNLRACMSKRSLMVHSAVSASLRPPDVVPLPNLVDTDAWTDELSHRLTLSWQGEEAWRAWWEDHLQLNREEKVEALKRKRRREKEARRAAGRRLELSGSFTSSISYQSEMEDFSDSTGWSSAASQGARSDTEGMGSQMEDLWKPGTPRAATPSTVQSDTPVPTPTATPQSVKGKQGDQQTPSSSCILSLSQTPKPDSTLTGQKRNKQLAKDYLSSLFAPQDESLQHDSYFLEEGSTDCPPPSSVASSSQLRSSQSVPQSGLRGDLSQDASVWSGFSQSLSLSQSSQGRLGLSQPKKKKSRMGF
ncbi:TATA box-binding protein-associated factor, RNA polymerase I, subunit C isoform X2 [Chaetodon auriga]|uniref:TATA box-binding protein-associated factor, RNA polymerase I, subunit C isoform X2 n=1 Tax=Chaetodon auriga TaxID=39042 RepID=UPI0040330B7F